MKKTLKEIAQLVDGTLLGDVNPTISGITNIDDASAEHITFAVPPHLEKAAECAAGAVIIPDTVTEFAKPAIRVANPRLAFTKLLAVFTPPLTVKREIHATAVIGENVRVGNNVAVMAHAVVADNVIIGDNTIIYPHVYIGENVSIGCDTILYPNVTIYPGCVVGARVILHSGTVIGADGFGFVTVDGRHQKVPQIGNVIIEDDVEIGANAAVDSATTGSTVICKGTKTDNFVHFAHNVVVGENCLFAAFNGVSGSVKIGKNVTFGGQGGTAGHLSIGDYCTFGGRTGIIGDIPPKSFYSGFPARPHRDWLRNEAAMRKVPDLIKTVQQLEKRIAEMEKQDK
ncbi:MAG: UDP-3-O-(3-hydroxymyristoyl) glucosamine N-acyltransferase [Firmicutes bacterium]|nr:UDP-3-O-(3-hydroxymyristoyl) glucosamine N-acyltransferase [Bacillota bacterium]